MIAAANDLRFCEGCASLRPADQFRKRSKTGSAQLRECRRCHNSSEQQRRARNRAQRDGRRVKQFVGEVMAKHSSDRLELLLKLMVAEFGGMEGFATAWYAYTMQVMGKGGYAGARCFIAIERLFELVAEREERQALLNAECDWDE
jgi:hypothetical protein